MRSRFLATCLFFSGASALVLEVCWFRRMAQVAGATSIAMGAVLAAVIGGMALGSWWIGRTSDEHPRPLRLYGLLEAGVVLAALLSPWLLDRSQGGFDFLLRNLGDTPLVLMVTRFALATLLLTLPAVLMGGTLPAIVCALKVSENRRGRAIGWLYAANTIGAVAGTLAAGFYLIPTCGLAWATRSAAIPSGIAAAVAFLTRPAKRGEYRSSAIERGPDLKENRKAVLLYAVSGFLGLTAEVAFTRQLVLLFGSTTYAFTAMLAVFLFGIGSGGAIGAVLAKRKSGHKRLLVNTVATTAALFSLATIVVYWMPRLYLDLYLRWGEGLHQKFLLSALILLPGSLGLGVAFPLAAHIATSGKIGAGTGRLYAANTLASILGSTLAVFVFVPWLGPKYTVVAAALVTAGVALFIGRRTLPLAMLLVTTTGLIPPGVEARERLLAGVYFNPASFLNVDRDAIDDVHWDDGVDIPFCQYGREATVAVRGWYGTYGVVIDGKAVATNQVLADSHHLALLGHLPMALHRNPQKVLVVGLGMGLTYRACAMSSPAVLRVVEIEEAVVEAAAFLDTKPADLVINDARSYLRATDEQFDVITSDPIHPWMRGGGDLYTVEYFESVRASLAGGGIACQWLPVYQMGLADIKTVIRTFCSVFPDAAAYYGGGDLVLVGANEPLRDPRVLQGRAREALVEIGADNLRAFKVAGRDQLVEASGAGILLTDDSLHLEFSAPRYVLSQELGLSLDWIRKLWGDPPEPYNRLLSAEISWSRGDRGFAQRQLYLAAKSHPHHGAVRRMMGENLMEYASREIAKGQLDQAGKDLIQARKWLPNDPRLLGIEADFHIAEGRKKRARELLEKLRERGKDSAYLRRRIKALE